MTRRIFENYTVLKGWPHLAGMHLSEDQYEAGVPIEVEQVVLRVTVLRQISYEYFLLDSSDGRQLY